MNKTALECLREIEWMMAIRNFVPIEECPVCGQAKDIGHEEDCLLAQAIAVAESCVREYPFQIHCRGKTRSEWLERLEGLLPPEFGVVDGWVAVEDGLPEEGWDIELVNMNTEAKFNKTTSLVLKLDFQPKYKSLCTRIKEQYTHWRKIILPK